MNPIANSAVEWQDLGKWLYRARVQQGLTQKELAVRAKISQPRISGIEKSEMIPTLPQLVRLARALVVPLQWFLNGSGSPGTGITDITLQLQSLKLVDLHVPGEAVPGAFRPTEEVFALAVSGSQPNPRIVEAIPALLAWNRWSASLLKAYSRPKTSRTAIRLAWLADIALTIHRTTGFPGGCPQLCNLESFVGAFSTKKLSMKDDDLGRPGDERSLPSVSKRWKIAYDAPLSAFAERAQHLNSLLEQRHLPERTSTRLGNE